MHPSTIKQTKRLYSFIPAQPSSSAAVAVLRRRPRAQSASSTSERRTFYTAAPASSSPLQYFDSSASTPSSSSRHSNTLPLPTHKPPSIESQNPHSDSGSSSNSHHGSQQTHSSTQQPLLGSSSMSPALSATPPLSGSPPPERSFSLNSSRARFQQSLAAGPSGSIGSASASSTETFPSTDVGEDRASLNSPSYPLRLDVGAYGIPKRRHHAQRYVDTSDFAGLDCAVQVGEDAYFVRDDAMGVADGVGGWAHSKVDAANERPSTNLRGYIRHTPRHNPRPSASALFARRLMHFCAIEAAEARLRVQAEYESRSKKTAPKPRPNIRHSMSPPTLKHHVSQLRDLSTRHLGRNSSCQPRNGRPFLWPWEEDVDSKMTYDASLNDLHAGTRKGRNAGQGDHLRDGDIDDVPCVDPLEVLERAYSRALEAHVERVGKCTPDSPPPSSCGVESLSPVSTHLHFNTTQANVADSTWKPLLAGSSTALLATLTGDHLRIAHLGDCTGLLLRGGDVIWRSEEMWWGFNYPLQLGPASPTQPRDARCYDLRVRADDILVLASDGMSDNLWEEDVVDEVKRFMGSPLNPITSGVPLGSLGRRAFAGMLSEALCSRARKVSEHSKVRKETSSTCGGVIGDRGAGDAHPLFKDMVLQVHNEGVAGDVGFVSRNSNGWTKTSIQRLSAVEDKVREPAIDCPNDTETQEDLPFSRRAMEEGRNFRGGKCDDISVIVALITPSAIS